MGRKQALTTLINSGEFVSWPVVDPLIGRWYETIKIGSVAWFQRMETEHPTFSFCLPGALSVTLRAEEKQRGSFYWIAYKRHGKKLKKQYLGRTEALTWARLVGVTHALNVPPEGMAMKPIVVTQQKPTRTFPTWDASQFTAGMKLSKILELCQAEYFVRYGCPMPWESIELRGRDYYAMPGNHFLHNRARAIRALLQWVNHGLDNAAARRDGRV